jgi:hypothetical protein
MLSFKLCSMRLPPPTVIFSNHSKCWRPGRIGMPGDHWFRRTDSPVQLAPNQFRAFASILYIENASVEGRYKCILHIDSEPFLFEFLIV